MYNHLIGSGFERWATGTYTTGQLEFINDTTTPSILFTGAYRAGKTEICSRAAIRHCLAFPGARFGVFRAKLKSLRQSTLRTLLELVHPSWVADWSNSELELRFLNDSSLVFLGCDFADRIGSIELTGALIDEAHEVDPESYGMIVGRLSGKLTVDEGNLELFPEFSDYARAAVNSRQTYLACNPKSTQHWLYREFIHPTTRLPGRAFYSSNTVTNLNLPQSYLEQNLAQYARPGVDQGELREALKVVRATGDEAATQLTGMLSPFGCRNLLGQWVALEGAIYEMDKELQVLEIPGEWQPLERYASADFGFHHPRLIEVTRYTNGQWVVTDSWSDAQVDPRSQLERLGEWAKRPGFRGVFLPPDQPGIIKQARQLLGAGKVLKANNRVLDGIASTQQALNTGVLRFQDTGDFGLFWDEMAGYSWKPAMGGGWKDEPIKEADHYPDALRYAVHSLARLKRLRLSPAPSEPPATSQPWDFVNGW